MYIFKMVPSADDFVVFLFFEAQPPGTTQDHLFNIETKAKMKSHQMHDQVVANFI